ncbi:hypothetical protein RND81_12G069800 [Saponaria officinalis]|uniref:Uncharacterized protein n=1 Tax=Saponaria officinalis TaxID=3572 RepID=A0AAW1H7I2_SAPOF
MLSPSWQCPQQSMSVEYGFFLMHFMFDIVKNCTTSTDLEKVWSSIMEDSYIDCEINEIRDKWVNTSLIVVVVRIIVSLVDFTKPSFMYIFSLRLFMIRYIKIV